MGFFKAPEANARIAELETAQANLTTEVANLTASVEAKAKEISELTTARDAATAQVTKITTERDAAVIERDAAVAEATKLKAEAKDAEERAVKIIASLGLNAAVKKDSVTSDPATKTEEQLWGEYHEIRDPAQRRAFFLEHKSILGK